MELQISDETTTGALPTLLGAPVLLLDLVLITSSDGAAIG